MTKRNSRRMLVSHNLRTDHRFHWMDVNKISGPSMNMFWRQGTTQRCPGLASTKWDKGNSEQYHQAFELKWIWTVCTSGPSITI